MTSTGGGGSLRRPSRPRPRREGVPLRGVTGLPVAAPTKERWSPPGALPNPILQGEGREHASEGQQWKSPECKPEFPNWGGREAHSGLGKPGFERETRTPTPPSGSEAPPPVPSHLSIYFVVHIRFHMDLQLFTQSEVIYWDFYAVLLAFVVFILSSFVIFFYAGGHGGGAKLRPLRPPT